MSEPALEHGGAISLRRTGGNPEWLRAAVAPTSCPASRWPGFALKARRGTRRLLAGSIALLGNGLDGAIEALASLIVRWRAQDQQTLSLTAERRGHQIVPVSFFLVAPYIVLEAVPAPCSVWVRDEPGD